MVSAARGAGTLEITMVSAAPAWKMQTLSVQFSVHFSYQVSAARGAGTLEITWFSYVAAAVANAAAADAATAAATGYMYFSYSQPHYSDAQT